MSVIAFDGKTIAADRQASSGSLASRTTKLRELPNGDVVGWTGGMENGLAVAQWYENGADPALWPKSQEGDEWSRLVVIPVKGRPFMYEQLPVKQIINEKRFASGNGRDFALGAMAVGASAVQAVRVASSLSPFCGLGVDSFKVR